MQKSIVLFFLLYATPVLAKVLIITHNYNGPQFIELQQKTFRKFLKDEYEFVLFNDAKDETTARQIEQTCHSWNVTHIRIPQEIHNRPYLKRLPGDSFQRPNIRHANCCQYSMDILGFNHEEIVIMIDSDMFLIRTFDVEEYMNNKDIAAFMKGSKTPTGQEIVHLCPALCFFDMRKLPDIHSLNFNCGTVKGASVDSGGWTYHYLEQHPQLNISYINCLASYKLFLGNYDMQIQANSTISNSAKIDSYVTHGFNEKEIQFLLKKPDTFEFFLDNIFVHYHGGSNYNNQSAAYHKNKWQIFTEFIASILNDFPE